ncbi:hypothetical protein NPIL_625031 [Nephila pilipes]|uniref:Uncharacterized protein n=1 Tax=Nephila pilipes TaxID=299642 RepID=A0A8X6MM73_NEPPI|nr:hypothetical protein NPIL_625031 [Nephila pilipes]
MLKVRATSHTRDCTKASDTPHRPARRTASHIAFARWTPQPIAKGDKEKLIEDKTKDSSRKAGNTDRMARTQTTAPRQRLADRLACGLQSPTPGSVGEHLLN